MLENFPDPAPIRLTTGGDEEAEIAERRDSFFNAVRDELGLSARRCDTFFSQETRGLYRPLEDGGTLPSDDWLHLLDFAGIQPIASVLDRRDDMNFHVVTFSAHALTKQAMDRVLAIRQAMLEHD